MGKRTVDASYSLVAVAARRGRPYNGCRKETGRAGKHGPECGVIRDDVCGVCQRPASARMVRGEVQPRGWNPPLWSTQRGRKASWLKRCGHRERVRKRHHVDRGVSMEGTDSFAPAIPACSEGYEFRFATCGFVCCPSVPDLLIPVLCIAGSAGTDMRSPDRGLSMSSHDHLLGWLLRPRAVGCGPIDRPLMTNIG
jgi:hypothetical protein